MNKSKDWLSWVLSVSFDEFTSKRKKLLSIRWKSQENIVKNNEVILTLNERALLLNNEIARLKWLTKWNVGDTLSVNNDELWDLLSELDMLSWSELHSNDAEISEKESRLNAVEKDIKDMSWNVLQLSLLKKLVYSNTRIFMLLKEKINLKIDIDWLKSSSDINELFSSFNLDLKSIINIYNNPDSLLNETIKDFLLKLWLVDNVENSLFNKIINEVKKFLSDYLKVYLISRLNNYSKVFSLYVTKLYEEKENNNLLFKKIENDTNSLINWFNSEILKISKESILSVWNGNAIKKFSDSITWYLMEINYLNAIFDKKKLNYNNEDLLINAKISSINTLLIILNSIESVNDLVWEKSLDSALDDIIHTFNLYHNLNNADTEIINNKIPELNDKSKIIVSQWLWEDLWNLNIENQTVLKETWVSFDEIIEISDFSVPDIESETKKNPKIRKIIFTSLDNLIQESVNVVTLSESSISVTHDSLWVELNVQYDINFSKAFINEWRKYVVNDEVWEKKLFSRVFEYSDKWNWEETNLFAFRIDEKILLFIKDWDNFVLNTRIFWWIFRNSFNWYIIWKKNWYKNLSLDDLKKTKILEEISSNYFPT